MTTLTTPNDDLCQIVSRSNTYRFWVYFVHQQVCFLSVISSISELVVSKKVNDLRLSAFNAKHDHSSRIDLVTVFDAILTSRQTCEKLQCLYENLMSNNFHKTAVLKTISFVN